MKSALQQGVETIRYRKTVYVPAPYVGLLLGSRLTPIEAWHRLWGAIVDAVAEDAYRPLIDWLRASLVRAIPNNYSALMVPEPLATLHRHLPNCLGDTGTRCLVDAQVYPVQVS